MNALVLLHVVCSVSSPLSLCCFQRACSLSWCTKGMFKATVCIQAQNRRRLFACCRGNASQAKQRNGVRWVSSVTDDAWWQNPGGERRNQSSPQSCRSYQVEIQACHSQKQTHLLLSVKDWHQRAFGFMAWLFLDRTFPSCKILSM